MGVPVQHTSRKPEKGEENGTHYHFVKKEVLSSMLDRGEVAEWEEAKGVVYATAFSSIKQVIIESNNVL